MSLIYLISIVSHYILLPIIHVHTYFFLMLYRLHFLYANLKKQIRISLLSFCRTVWLCHQRNLTTKAFRDLFLKNREYIPTIVASYGCDLLDVTNAAKLFFFLSVKRKKICNIKWIALYLELYNSSNISSRKILYFFSFLLHT